MLAAIDPDPDKLDAFLFAATAAFGFAAITGYTQRAWLAFFGFAGAALATIAVMFL